MKSMDQFRRHEVNAKEALGTSGFLDGMFGQGSMIVILY